MRPTLLMLHGWGFDASLWDKVATALPDFPIVRWDRGYFGSPAEPPIEGPFVAIGHSLGAMLLAGLSGASGLIVINGFDRFAGDGAVAPRLVERMRARFGETPAEVLNDFRKRCRAHPLTDSLDSDRLGADLALLATADRRGCETAPTLVLHGADDPILPPVMRDSVFAGAPREIWADGGHLLPLTHPERCAERIRSFAS